MDIVCSLNCGNCWNNERPIWAAESGMQCLCRFFSPWTERNPFYRYLCLERKKMNHVVTVKNWIHRSESCALDEDQKTGQETNQAVSGLLMTHAWRMSSLLDNFLSTTLPWSLCGGCSLDLCCNHETFSWPIILQRNVRVLQAVAMRNSHYVLLRVFCRSAREWLKAPVL